MSTYPLSHLAIKSWAEEDRPREKLLFKGKASLSNAELIAIILGSGNRNETAVGLAQRILQSVDNNLDELGKRGLAELQKFKGIGEAKAISVIAAMEIGRRRQLSDVKDRPQVNSSRNAFEAIAPLIADLPHEEFWVLHLNRANKIIGRERISSGGTAGTVVDAKIIFRKALEGFASSIILSHNHPSGSLFPSQADILLTKKLITAGKVLDISVLDHIIVAGKEYYSFADEDKM